MQDKYNEDVEKYKIKQKVVWKHIIVNYIILWTLKSVYKIFLYRKKKRRDKNG